MKNIYHRLLLLIAGSTQKELAAQIRYLKVENEVLRSKLPKRISVTVQEKNRLMKFGGRIRWDNCLLAVKKVILRILQPSKNHEFTFLHRTVGIVFVQGGNLDATDP